MMGKLQVTLRSIDLLIANPSAVYATVDSARSFGRQIRHSHREHPSVGKRLAKLEQAITSQARSIITPELVYRLLAALEISSGLDVKARTDLHIAYQVLQDWAAKGRAEAKFFYRQYFASHTLAAAEYDAKYGLWLTILFCLAHGVDFDRVETGHGIHPSILHLYDAWEDSDAAEIIETMYTLTTHFSCLMIPRGAPTEKFLHEKLELVEWECPNEHMYGALMSLSYRANLLASRYEDPAYMELWNRTNEKGSVILDHIIRLIDEVSQQPNYDVRPGGRDVYCVEGVLGKLDGRHRAFIREGFAFPSVGVTVRHPWLSGYRNILNDLYPGEERAAYLTSPQGCDDTDPTMNLTRILVDLVAYHRVVCAPHGTSRNKDNPQRQPVSKEESERIERTVRSHFRLLPEGYVASEDRIQTALRILKNRPPTGRTFVEGYDVESASSSAVRQRVRLEQIPPLFTIDPLEVINAL